MTRYPTQSRDPETELTSPCLILLMLNSRLEIDRHQLYMYVIGLIRSTNRTPDISCASPTLYRLNHRAQYWTSCDATNTLSSGLLSTDRHIPGISLLSHTQNAAHNQPITTRQCADDSAHAQGAGRFRRAASGEPPPGTHTSVTPARLAPADPGAPMRRRDALSGPSAQARRQVTWPCLSHHLAHAHICNK